MTISQSPWGSILHTEELEYGIRWVESEKGEGLILSHSAFPELDTGDQIIFI